MPRIVGLRVEILVNLTILVGAALLFAGFLFLKLTENELVNQRVSSSVALTEVLARSLAVDPNEARMLDRAYAALQPLPEQMEAWVIYDSTLQAVGSFKAETFARPDDPGRYRFAEEPIVAVEYLSGWLLQGEANGCVSVIVPLHRQGEFSGLLKARFSLAVVRQRVGAAQRLILLYVVLYGVVLIVFGLYLLGRNVVRPIGRLRELTRTVAAGNLEVSLDVEGPREIADLSASFNQMIASLRQSREETQLYIASLQQADEDLIRSEKMASVGHLAAGMAHEIGNPLGAVVGYLELLKSELTDAGQCDLADRILVEVGRIDRLVRELLDFAAPSSSASELFDPVLVATESLELLQNQGVFDVRKLENRLPPALPQVVMVRHRLQQVLVNLLLNARDATTAGASICLAGGVERNRPWLAVHDSGSGIPPEVLPHVFDPFYSTKAPGKGRGLGLAICQRIMEEAGGSIEVRSKAGEGSEFRLWFKARENR